MEESPLPGRGVLDTMEERLHTRLANQKKVAQPARNVEVGDVVILRDNAPRNCWPLGIVTETKKCRDGLVRSVTVKLKPTQSGSVRVMRRAVHDLVVILQTQE